MDVRRGEEGLLDLLDLRVGNGRVSRLDGQLVAGLVVVLAVVRLGQSMTRTESAEAIACVRYPSGLTTHRQAMTRRAKFPAIEKIAKKKRDFLAERASEIVTITYVVPHRQAIAVRGSFLLQPSAPQTRPLLFDGDIGEELSGDETTSMASATLATGLEMAMGALVATGADVATGKGLDSLGAGAAVLPEPYFLKHELQYPSN
jgi:hypothetical protein